MLDLAGKHIVVTGASSGIGRATCIQASKLGAKVSLIARSESKLKETVSLMDGDGHKDRHKTYCFDLNNITGIDELIKTVVEQNGLLDGLVHCAGAIAYSPLKLLESDFVEQMMRLHYFAFVELIRIAASKKRSSNGASFIGISSIAAFHGDKAQGAYSAAKAAMNGAIHSFAKELAPRGIRVNTITFGMVDTGMYKSFTDVGGNSEELLKQQYLGIIPVEYAGKAVCFMLSDLSKYMTGGTLIYDAGRLS